MVFIMDDVPQTRVTPVPVPVRDLDAIEVGDTEAARLTYRLLRGLPQDEAKDRLVQAGNMLRVSSWTVYRWLRGKANPRRAAFEALEALVKQVEAAA